MYVVSSILFLHFEVGYKTIPVYIPIEIILIFETLNL